MNAISKIKAEFKVGQNLFFVVDDALYVVI